MKEDGKITHVASNKTVDIAGWTSADECAFDTKNFPKFTIIEHAII